MPSIRHRLPRSGALVAHKTLHMRKTTGFGLVVGNSRTAPKKVLQRKPSDNFPGAFLLTYIRMRTALS